MSVNLVECYQKRVINIFNVGDFTRNDMSLLSNPTLHEVFCLSFLIFFRLNIPMLGFLRENVRCFQEGERTRAQHSPKSAFQRRSVIRFSSHFISASRLLCFVANSRIRVRFSRSFGKNQNETNFHLYYISAAYQAVLFVLCVLLAFFFHIVLLCYLRLVMIS